MIEENQQIISKNHLVAIVILSHNKKKDILECLDSIFKLDYIEFEVIVIDNASSDGSVDEIKTKYPNVHLNESKINLGVARGRNLGVRYANKKFNYKFLLFLDDDIVIDKNALSEMVNSFNINGNIGIVTPKCYLTNFPGVIGYAGGMSVNLWTGKITNIGDGEKDERQLIEAILKILENPQMGKEMGQRGKKLVEKEFSSEKVAEKWIEEYNEIINNA